MLAALARDVDEQSLAGHAIECGMASPAASSISTEALLERRAPE
jgi:hypothetical protein